MAQVPFMKLFIAEGYYDLATPPASVDYSVNHMRLPKELQSNVTTKLYEGGHMMYIYEPSMEQLRKDLAEFFESALNAKPAGDSYRADKIATESTEDTEQRLKRISRMEWLKAITGSELRITRIGSC